MDDKKVTKEIFERDEKAIREISELENKEKATEEKYYTDTQDDGNVTRLTRKEEHAINEDAKAVRDFDKKRDKILKDTHEKDFEDAQRMAYDNESRDAYENSKIERRDEAESRRSLHQTEFVNEKEKIEERFEDDLIDHDRRKLAKLTSKADLSEHDKKEIEKLQQKIAEHEQKIKDYAAKEDAKLDAKQAEDVEKVLEKDAKDGSKEVFE